MIVMRNLGIRAIVVLTIAALPATAHAQIQIGTLTGIVSIPTGAPLSGARLELNNPITGYRNETTTDAVGGFVFNNIPFDAYMLHVNARGFQTFSQGVNVRSNIPIHLDIHLSVAGPNELLTVNAKEGLVETDSSSTETDIDESLIRRSPGAALGNQLQRLIATTPGWATQNNGLLHIRGVDDGMLYVIDGVPTADRIDSTTGNSLDTEMIRSIDVITGNIPAEFGGRSGAVITIQPVSGIDLPLNGSLGMGAGNFRTGEITATLGGNLKRKFGFFLSSSGSRTDRFLDPVDVLNFNSMGKTLKLNLRSDWHPTATDIFLVNVGANGTNLHVPNTLTQEQAGQDQRQVLRDASQSVSWQHSWSLNTVSDIAYFRRFAESELMGSEFDTPLFASQDRKHVRQGILAGITRTLKRHTFKVGVEAARVTPREYFTFAVTDRESAAEEGISEAAQEFDRANPFVFHDRKVRGQISWYVQDSFTAMEDLTVSAGLRYDHSSLPAADQQFSPRIGAVYYIPKTKTAFRASFNRLYMPPQVENLLLADSEQARALSPFATEAGAGGAQIQPEKISAYEVGFSQDILGIFKLDAAYWWRFFRNFDDPNVFFGTTVIFPNSVAKGFSRGLDVRLDLPDRKGWSGYVSYTNSRVLQTGPINGGLFLTEDAIAIGPGTTFIPDHDQRNVGSGAINYYNHATGLWATFAGRHESGIVLEVDPDTIAELQSAPGAELVNFDRGRVKPWTTLDCSVGADLRRDRRVAVSAQFDVRNITNRPFAYNFGNPFEGTHFGHPRLWSGRIRFKFR